MMMMNTVQTIFPLQFFSQQNNQSFHLSPRKTRKQSWQHNVQSD